MLQHRTTEWATLSSTTGRQATLMAEAIVYVHIHPVHLTSAFGAERETSEKLKTPGMLEASESIEFCCFCKTYRHGRHTSTKQAHLVMAAVGPLSTAVGGIPDDTIHRYRNKLRIRLPIDIVRRKPNEHKEYTKPHRALCELLAGPRYLSRAAKHIQLHNLIEY